MITNGFIVLYRSLLDWEWYSDINTKTLFIHLLLTANYEPKKWQGIVIERGQRVFSFSNLACETGLSIRSVRTSISKLKTTGELTSTATNKYSVITIKNYNVYQDVDKQSDKPTVLQDDKRATNERQTSDNNETKLTSITSKQVTREKDNSIELSKKTPYGEFKNVLLNGQEHSKLVDSLGDKCTNDYIERLSAYLAQIGKRYKSHYATILNWWRKDGKPIARYVENNQFMKPDIQREFTDDMTAGDIF